MVLRRWIDREKDSYFESVTDTQTGEIVHHSQEPLSKHRGARFREIGPPRRT
jgi:hypothetical protein